jgi:hypothetical protein
MARAAYDSARLHRGFAASGLKRSRRTSISECMEEQALMGDITDFHKQHAHRLRDLARNLRSEQSGPDWEDLRKGVAALVCRLIQDNPQRYKLTDHRHGIGSAILVPLTDAVGALQSDGAIFLIECISEWTPLGSTKAWRNPFRPTITMVAVNIPSGPLH